MQQRQLKRLLKGREVIEGAGVRMKRIAGYDTVYEADPFLLFDDFRNKDAMFYKNGFPFHPHRGIECVTYMLEGSIEHEDTLGNKGLIKQGDAQWLRAGSGVIHKEMPRGNKNGSLKGFQMWLNLPSGEKMCRPEYQAVPRNAIPAKKLDNGVKIKLIAGRLEGEEGPVKSTGGRSVYADISVPKNTVYDIITPQEECFMAYVIRGGAYFGAEAEMLRDGAGALFECGTHLRVETGREGVRFLLLGGRPLKENIAWYGPIVMNTHKEIKAAINDIENGTFVKKG